MGDTNRELARELDLLEDTISEAVLVQPAFICYTPGPYDDAAAYARDPDPDLEDVVLKLDDEKARNFGDLLINALKASPYIHDLHQVTEDRELGYGGSTYYSVISTDVYGMKISLPARFQTPSGTFEENPIENFGVLIDGSFALVYATVGDIPRKSTIGVQFGNLLKKQISETTNIFAQMVGPPHWVPDWYLLPDLDPNWGFGDKVLEWSGQAVISGKHTVSEEENVFALYQRVEVPLRKTVRAVARSEEIFTRSIEMRKVFEELGRTIQSLTEVSWWNYIKKWRLQGDAAPLLTRLNRLLVRQERDISSHESRVSGSLASAFEESELAQPLKHSVIDHVTVTNSMPDHFKKTLNFFDRQARTVASARGTLVAGVLGTLIGTLIGVLLAG